MVASRAHVYAQYGLHRMLPRPHHSVCSADTFQINEKVHHRLLRTLHCSTGVQQHSSDRQTHKGNSNIGAQLHHTRCISGSADKTDK